MLRIVGLLLGAAACLFVFDTAQAADQTVTMVAGNQFVPVTVSIEAGESVTWTNQDSTGTPHTASDRQGNWDTGNLAVGQSKTIRFTTPGSFEYYCKYHPTMVGTVQVAEPSSPPPTVTIASPEEDEAVARGTVVVSGTASAGTKFVWVVVDGGQRQDATGAEEWTWSWDTSQLTPGSKHTLKAIASDGTREGESAVVEVEIEVQNGVPTITLDVPVNGTTLAGTVLLRGNATDPENAISKVEIRVDAGDWRGATGVAPWTYAWDTRGVANGTHTLEARATDAKGAVATAGPVSVVVKNEVGDDAAPTIEITFPTNGSMVKGLIAVSGTAGDDLALDDVQVRVDGGEWTTADGTTSWTFPLDTTRLANGTHFLEARARDRTSHETVVNVTIFVDNPPPTSALTLALDPGAVLRGVVNLTGDAKGVLVVEVRIDNGSWLPVAPVNGTWRLAWDTRAETEGVHGVSVRASDGERMLEQGPVYVLVDNVAADEEERKKPPTNKAPIVSHFEPAAGTSVAGAVRFLVVATDPEGGAVDVTLRVDGKRLTGGVAPLDYLWPAYEAPFGEHAVLAEVCDASGACASREWTFTVVPSTSERRTDGDRSTDLVDDEPEDEDPVQESGRGSEPLAAEKAPVPAPGVLVALAVALLLLRRKA